MTWVPLLNIVLTVVFYAMFPVIFPLFLIPRSGTTALKGYFSGFFYLAAWGPLYVVLHMFIMDRTADAMNATSPGGVTMAGMAGIDAVNTDTATIAGFLMMSIPFLAAGMAKGAMAVSSQATSMLAPAQSAAEAAAVERTTGNYAYGNESYMNLSSSNRQSDQWNTAPSFAGGAPIMSSVGANAAITRTTSDGSTIYDTSPAMSRLGLGRDTDGGFAPFAKNSYCPTTDITRDVGWEPIHALGLLGVRQIALDEDWSALRSRFKDEIPAITRSSPSGGRPKANS